MPFIFPFIQKTPDSRRPLKHYTGSMAEFTVTHQRHFLLLLGSPSDMVHGFRLRKTNSSTQKAVAQTTQKHASDKEFSPAIADLRNRAPLAPHLVRQEYYSITHKKNQVIFEIWPKTI